MARRSTLAASTRHALPFHPPIVVDAGAAYLRVGVASEPRPRAVVATPVRARRRASPLRRLLKFYYLRFIHPVPDCGGVSLRMSRSRRLTLVVSPHVQAALDPVRVVASRGKRPSAEEWAALLAPVVDEICYE